VWANSSEAAAATAAVSTDDMHTSHAEYFTARARGDQTWSSPASYEATVTNTGSLGSDFVLLGFVSSPTKQLADPKEPLRELFDFARVSLQPKESTVVRLSVPASVLSHVDERGDERLLAGDYQIELGGESLGDASGLETTLTVTGEDKMLFSLSEVRSAQA
jgi:phage baseplate assembly protein gpV